MKRIIALMLAMMMALTLVACGSKKNDGGAAGGLDMTSEELQPITDQRASKDALVAAKDYFISGLSSSPDEFSKKTYQDMVDYIGVEASEFQYFASWQQYRYTWYVEGSSGPALLAVFNSTTGTLSSATASID